MLNKNTEDKQRFKKGRLRGFINFNTPGRAAWLRDPPLINGRARASSQ